MEQYVHSDSLLPLPSFARSSTAFAYFAVRTALLAIIGFMPTKAEGAIGGLDYSAEERKKLAQQVRSGLSLSLSLSFKFVFLDCNTSTYTSCSFAFYT